MLKILAAALAAAGLAGAASAQPAAPAPQRSTAGQEGGGAIGTAAQTERGKSLFEQRCKSCHDPAVDRAPTKAGLAGRWPEEIVASLKVGVMQPMAAGLSDPDINSIAVYLTGRAPAPQLANAEEGRNRCPASNRFSASGPSWNGWSPGFQNTRVAVSTTIKAADAPRLKVKWAFAYQGGRYGQPTVLGNRVFVTSSSGVHYALDKATGCVAWSYSTGVNGSRLTVVTAKTSAAPSGYVAIFGDYGRTLYALDAASGKEVWKVNIEKHPRGVLTGAPTLYNGVLYVPVSSWEETISSVAAYECCTFRGSVVAVDVNSGKVKWKSYVLPEAKPFKKSAAGAQMYGPAGAAIWAAPTIDPKRGLLYVVTGDSYTDVKEDSSDAVVAMDLATGAIRWKNQVTENDNFLTGCPPNRPAVNCPSPVGPDHDFGSAPILKHLKNGRDVLYAGQKSGQVYALDPDNKGRILWTTRIGRGGALGGVEWGMAADDDNLYVAVNQGGMPSLTALRLADGAQLWQHRAPDPKCSFAGRCGNGYSAPPTLANGVLYGPNQDGHIRAFEAKTGKLIWDYDTAGRKYDTVNGVKNQRGGNLDATGITFAGDMAFIMAGFNGASSASGPDNVLLAFSTDGK